MKKIQFGLVVEAPGKLQQDSYLDDMNRALDLVTGHFDSVWHVDHLQFGEMSILEGFTTLTYLAALHPQFKFGHSVLCQSFRNPALLAKMAATLQLLSGGRYILGLGAGWHEEEYRAYGYDFPSNRVRVEQLEEAVQIIRALFTEDKATFEGKHYQVVEARCEPKPEPPPLIMIGAFKPRMLRLAAIYADWWNVSSTGARAYRGMKEIFDQACVEVGRDPATVRRTWGGGCACAPTQAEAESFTESWLAEDDDEDFDFVGTPKQVIEQMQPFIDLGVDYFMLDCGGFPRLTTLEMLVHEVLPVLNTSEDERKINGTRMDGVERNVPGS
jgi:alkanesulfonate monooxygenase SsuD/methylene tetrahydromethanopterin reductase-like flavin-dependent oxidoreductase (luciferase family)